MLTTSHGHRPKPAIGRALATLRAGAAFLGLAGVTWAQPPAPKVTAAQAPSTIAGPAQSNDPATIPLAAIIPDPLVHRIQRPTEKVDMVINSSRIITLDQKIPEVQVNNPEIVKVTPLSPTEIQLFAQKAGVTSVHLRTADKRVFTVDVIVQNDARELELRLRTSFPRSALKVEPLANAVLISGMIDDPAHVNTIITIAQDYYPTVINNMFVGGAQQVALKVKIYEVSRTKLRNLGFDFAGFTSSGSSIISNASGLLSVSGAALQTANATGAQTVTFGVLDGTSSFFGLLEALRQDELAKILAEPTIVAISGRPAYFNAGGEIPILVPQSLGTVSIQYRPYGTELNFVPIVRGSGRLRLEVRPRVSEIDPARSVTINGTTVPALRTREVDTAVEMIAGQTLAIGGLVQTRLESSRRGIPWLMDVPFLGGFFSRKHEQTNDIELLIVVTPEFVAAVDPANLPPCLPGTTTTSPSDVQLYYKHHIEVPKNCPPGETGPQSPVSMQELPVGGVQGPIGAPVPMHAPVPAPAPRPEIVPPGVQPVPGLPPAPVPPPRLPELNGEQGANNNPALQEILTSNGVVPASNAPKLERIPAVQDARGSYNRDNSQNRASLQTARRNTYSDRPGMVGPVGSDVLK